MPGERYFPVRDRLLDCCGRIEKLAKASGIAPVDDEEDHRERLALPLRVVALGEVNAGKSTLLNALAGVEVCEAGPLPMTKATTIHRYGEVANEGRTKQGWVDLQQRVEFLRRFELVDTPGSNSDARDTVRAEIGIHGDSDLVMIVFPAANTWTAASWDLVSALSDAALDHTVLVVQQADTKPAGDLQVIRGHMSDLSMKKVGRELPIFAVAARLALEAKLEPDGARENWAASGFEVIEDFVSERICGSPEREHMLHRTAQQAGRRLREIEEGMDRQRRGMDDDGWFLTGLEREADALRELILETSSKALAGARRRYEGEVARLAKTLGGSLGLWRTGVRLFLGDSSPAKIEATFADHLQAAIRDFAQGDAERLLDECGGHWGEVRPRVKDRMGMDPGESSLAGARGSGAAERFVARVGRAVTAVLGQLRVRAKLDAKVRRRNQRLRAIMGLVLLLLTVAGVAGTLEFDPLAFGLLAGAALVGVIGLLVAWASRRSLVGEMRALLLDSAGQFEAAMRGDYAEAVRGLFQEYSNGLIGVRRQLAERRATLEPRAKAWDRLYLELKSIEQDMG